LVGGTNGKHSLAGGKQDLITNRIHFRNRDYDAEQMRWNKRDPVGFEGSKWNLFVYVKSNPQKYIDPLGLWDLFGGVELDLIGITGIEVGMGFVIDWDTPLDQEFMAQLELALV